MNHSLLSSLAFSFDWNASGNVWNITATLSNTHIIIIIGILICAPLQISARRLRSKWIRSKLSLCLSVSLSHTYRERDRDRDREQQQQQQQHTHQSLACVFRSTAERCYLLKEMRLQKTFEGGRSRGMSTKKVQCLAKSYIFQVIVGLLSSSLASSDGEVMISFCFICYSYPIRNEKINYC